MLDEIKDVFVEVFDVESEKVTEQTTIDNLDEWDSLKHLELVMKLEEKFSCKFSMDEIINLNSVEAILSAVGSKAA